MVFQAYLAKIRSFLRFSPGSVTTDSAPFIQVFFFLHSISTEIARNGLQLAQNAAGATECSSANLYPTRQCSNDYVACKLDFDRNVPFY